MASTDTNKTNEKAAETAADTNGKATEPTSDTSQTTGNTRQAAAEPTKQPLSPDRRRTLTFVVGALVCLSITGIVEWSNRPAAIEEFGKVGQEFYANFSDPTLATSLEVYVFDTDKVRPLDFRVQRLDNGRWAIPSHHNYPADAEDRLAKTAASIIGIRRGAMITRWQADHARFGVVNPKQDTLRVTDVEGVGKRIILRGEDDSVLADYIIGNKAEGESNQYYLRHPEEEEVYLTKLDIDLSTKFTDWIQTDLLDVDNWDITEVIVNDYSFDELRGELTKREVSTFRRETSSGPWTLDGSNEETEEIDKDAIRETVNAVADLKIVGVRPKQQGLSPDLKLDRQVLKSQHDVSRLQSDLLTRGFLLQPGEDGDQESLRLMAREGEMYAATDEGLVYRLHFGRAFAGSQEELEIGFSSKEDEDKEESGDNEASSDESENNTSKDDEAETASKGEAAESTSSGTNSDDDSSGGDDKDEDDVPKADDESASGTEDDEKTDSNKPGRYVFVRVEFDKKYLGEEPVKPDEPEKPAELKEPAGPKETDEAQDSSQDDPKSEEKPKEEAKNAESANQSDNEETKEELSDSKEEDPLAEIRKKYEEAKRKYEDDSKEYDRKSKEFEKKIEDGKQKAEELNRRFADWYYVISGDSFDKLRLSRADLVKVKEKKEEEEKKDPDENKGNSEPEFTAANQAAADEFLAENKSKEGVMTTASGLQYKVITEGQGESPEASNTVLVKYKGTLLDGSIFDESGDEAVEFGVDQVIKGWTEALQLMKPGAKWRLFIPPALAYGEHGSEDKIGSNALLIFDVELISFE